MEAYTYMDTEQAWSIKYLLYDQKDSKDVKKQFNDWFILFKTFYFIVFGLH